MQGKRFQAKEAMQKKQQQISKQKKFQKKINVFGEAMLSSLGLSGAARLKIARRSPKFIFHEGGTASLSYD